MGISGLLPLLKSIHQQKHIRDWAGKTVGIDAYGWLHKGTIACAIDLALGNPTTKYVDYTMNRVQMLRHYGVTPYLVFDGDYLPSKAATESERERKRQQSRQTGLELLKLGRTAQAHLELQKAIDVTPAMARHIIDACKLIDVKCIVAPYEADAQLYYLERTGIVDAIVSEDSDLLVFGAQCLITKLDQFGECVEINRQLFSANKEVSLVGWTDTEFRHMCILSGCDYLQNIPKMGLKTAHRLVRKHKQVEKIIRIVQMDGTMSVPKGYLQAFKQADFTFQYQRVFCPVKKEIVMCNEPNDQLEGESLLYLGVDMDLDLARGIACGNIDPITKDPIVVTPSVNSRLTKSEAWAQPPKPQTTSNKTITSFFKPQSKPRMPLQALSNNTLALNTVVATAEPPGSVPMKRSSSSLVSSAKRACITRLEKLPDNVIKTGERSSFFQAPDRTQSRRCLKPMANQRAVNTTQRPLSRQPANIVIDQESSSLCSNLTSRSPEEAVKRVTDSWKSTYSFNGAGKKSLSSIIQKQRNSKESTPRPTPLQRLSLSSLNRPVTPTNSHPAHKPLLSSLKSPATPGCSRDSVHGELQKQVSTTGRRILNENPKEDELPSDQGRKPRGFRGLFDKFTFVS